MGSAGKLSHFFLKDVLDFSSATNFLKISTEFVLLQKQNKKRKKGFFIVRLKSTDSFRFLH